MPLAGFAGVVGLATTIAFSGFAWGLAKTSALLGSGVAEGAGRASMVGFAGGTSVDAGVGLRVGFTSTISVLASGLFDSS